MVWFQKISISPPLREFEIPGVGGSKAQEILERREDISDILFPDSQVQ